MLSISLFFDFHDPALICFSLDIAMIHILKELKVDELCQMVLCAKSFANPIFVLPYPFRQVAGDTGIQSAVCLVC